MIEFSANPAVHAALARARTERGRDVASAWNWLFTGKTSRR